MKKHACINNSERERSKIQGLRWSELNTAVHNVIYKLSWHTKSKQGKLFLFIIGTHLCLTVTLFERPETSLCFAHEGKSQSASADNNLSNQLKCQPADKQRFTRARKTLSNLVIHPCSDKDALVDKLIKISNRNNNIDVSNKFVSAIKTGVSAYPQAILNHLINNKYEVHLGNLVTTCLPTLTGKHPKGYLSEEATYDTAGAVFDRRKKWIIIGEYSYRGKDLIPTPDYEHTVQHEIGHALDTLLGYPSHSVEFIESYQNDRKLIPAKRKQHLRYFLQGGDSGPQETFSELSAAKYGDPLDRWTFHLSTAFPRCSALLEKLLPESETKEQIEQIEQNVPKPAQSL
ncbi:MAG: hypothetical protein QG574_1960 [Cyanobacteriota bacterium erpe_2018_sw_21hr_WHONDRS-SW48-000092_B_bin.40]|nr:hypothetical protein [Cyanobacteriota bacterium erpe_2018_sw_21hr_WHONDRS-SW48-000092_B_bin.40]